MSDWQYKVQVYPTSDWLYKVQVDCCLCIAGFEARCDTEYYRSMWTALWGFASDWGRTRLTFHPAPFLMSYFSTSLSA